MSASVATVEAVAPTGTVRRAVSTAASASISLESVAWIGLLALAFFTRFWQLGEKALHHDESLHAYYSWLLATGSGYTHDPLMHGPLLFHLNALVYLLFGASDATSRLAPAFFGVLIVGLPYLLRGRRFLGRWGALATGALLLISPTIMYQSRYIRHDVYTVFGSLLIFICLVRYLERPERKWLVTLGVATAAMLANHEIIFGILLLFGLFLYGALLFERLHAWWGSRPDLVTKVLAIHLGAVVAVGALLLLMPERYMERFLAIPWDRRGVDASLPSRENQIGYYRDLATNWLILGLIAVGILFLVGLALTLRSVRQPDAGAGWLDGWAADAAPRSVAQGLRSVVADRSGWQLALGLFALVFVGLFTTLFTHWYGIFSSTVATDGTLLYWLGQHGYRRGEQPWFYYLLLMPQYEFIAVTLGLVLAIVTAVRLGLVALGREALRERDFFRAFLTFWFFGIFAILSWAGEKMPWLVVHAALPAVVLAGSAVGSVVERVARLHGERRLRRGDWLIAIGVLLCFGAWFFLAARLTLGSLTGDCANGGTDCRTVPDDDLSRWWQLLLPFAAVALIVAGGIWLRGVRRTVLMTALSVIAALGLLQTQAAWRLSFTNPDVPVEMMVYTQTSPDIKQLTTQLRELSEELEGSGDNQILFQTGGTQDAVGWPMNWYFRDFGNARPFGSATIPANSDAAVILIGSEASGRPENKSVLANYTGIEYPLRWWFPEELYREFAIAPEIPAHRSAWGNEANPHGPGAILGSIFDSLGTVFTAEGQQELFRLLVYRDLNDRLGQTSFKLYVRNDLVPLFNEIRY